MDSVLNITRCNSRSHRAPLYFCTQSAPVATLFQIGAYQNPVGVIRARGTIFSISTVCLFPAATASPLSSDTYRERVWRPKVRRTWPVYHSLPGGRYPPPLLHSLILWRWWKCVGISISAEIRLIHLFHCGYFTMFWRQWRITVSEESLINVCSIDANCFMY